MKEINLTNIRKAFNNLSLKTEEDKNNFLEHLARILWEARKEITQANQKDVINAYKSKLSKSFIARLTLNETAIKGIIRRLQDIQKLSANLGDIIEQRKLKNGIELTKIKVAIGVIAVIYESRPEVTIDIAALCVKSGNCAILKGGSEAILTNRIFLSCIQAALKQSSMDVDTVTSVTTRQVIDRLLQDGKDLDLVIARGGYDLVKSITAKSRVPVLAHCAGGARIYIDKSASRLIAKRVIINAKTDKPSACNSLDTILIHSDISSSFVSDLKNWLRAAGVSIISGKEFWGTEFLDLRVSIKSVRNVDEAIGFIGKYGKKHSEGIIAQDPEVIKKFSTLVDSAAIFINCSTRLHDGYEFGLGSEMGISTGKFHARGPVGLRELTTYKWEVYGDGQIRE